MNLNEKTKENIKVFIGIIFFNSIILANFLKMHYAQDTYCVISYGYKKISKVAFLWSGRPITAIIFYIANFLKLNVETLVGIMSIISLFTLSISVFILYKNILKLHKNKKLIELLAVLVISYITIINFTTMDLLVFVESGVLCIALLLCVLAACEWLNNPKPKYLKIFILLYIAALCHQAILNIYVPLGLMFVAFKNKDDVKKAFREAFLVLLFYGIAIISGIITSNIINSIFNIGARETIIPSIPFIFETYGKYLNLMVVETLGVGPKCWHIVVMSIITAVFLINNIKNKDKKINLFYYTAILLSAILLPILPVTMQEKTAQYLEFRMALSFGASIGIMLLYTLLSIKETTNKIFKFIIAFSCLIFIFNGQYIVKSSGEMVATNLMDRNFAKTIIYNIEQYEIKNNTQVKYIAIQCDLEPEFFYDGSEKYRCLNIKSIATDWDLIEMLEVFSGRKFEPKKVTEEAYNKYFAGKNWKYFDEEQLVFVDDTLYICIY